MKKFILLLLNLSLFSVVYEYQVEKMTCDSCANHIKNTVSKELNLNDVQLTFADKKLIIQSEKELKEETVKNVLKTKLSSYKFTKVDKLKK